jgi:ribosome-binding protein aMBF1 (putative translation factor)
LGIAQRQIRIKYAQKSRKQQRSKPLPTSIKTLGDLIQVKRMEKNLTSCHLAAKMGIATALIRSWEDGTTQPDNQQIAVLAKLLEFDARPPSPDKCAGHLTRRIPPLQSAATTAGKNSGEPT